VLAKHDENYMPPEAAKAVNDAQNRAAAAAARVRSWAAPRPTPWWAWARC